jgi:hypothetical protein
MSEKLDLVGEWSFQEGSESSAGIENAAEQRDRQPSQDNGSIP